VLLNISAVFAMSSSPSPALAVTRDGGWLELCIADAGASPQELTDDLREAGVHGEVRLVAVPEPMVGTWAVVLETEDRPGMPPASAGVWGPRGTAKMTSGVEYARETIRIPVGLGSDSASSFVFYAGRPAEDGEPYSFDGVRLEGFKGADRP
jgi:hypothetical protein